MTSLHQTASALSSSWKTVGAITNQPAGQILTSTSAINQYAALLSSLEQASLQSALQSAFTLVTQNGGVCLMSMTAASPSPSTGASFATVTPILVSYHPATTVSNNLEARGLRSFQTSVTYAYVTSAGAPTGVIIEPEIPASDIPLCEPVQAVATPTFSSDPAATALSDSGALKSTGDGSVDGDVGLDTGQRAGLAVGIVAAVVAALVLGVWWFRRRAMRRRSTSAQRHLWGWGAGDDGDGSRGGNSPAGAGVPGSVGAGNAEVAEARHMVSGLGLREVLYGRAGVRSHR